VRRRSRLRHPPRVRRVTDTETRTYPGARRPDRQRWVDATGVRLAVHEWGDEGAPPLLLAHGGFDFAGTFDVFAPILAEAGWRVVSWDQRGHGDSEHAALYQWDADIRDALGVFDSVTSDPVPVLGHSKGGSLMSQLAASVPGRISSLVNIDGVPSRRSSPDVQDRDQTKLLADELAGWLDHRRRSATNSRKPGTIEELATRRSAMNPRLSQDWLEYLVTVGARRDPDGWRWKIDPSLRMGGFGPWRPEWSLHRLPDITVPFLVILGSEPEPMGWGTKQDDVWPYLPRQARAVEVESVGHFVHIEDPHRTAELVLDHLGRPGARS
jgi:pimeloyl-ACP methyl ester carboxylesterase